MHTAIPSRRDTSPRFLSRVALGAVLLACGASAWAQVPPGCPNVCNQKYALCIAASCDPKTGQCGQCSAPGGICGFCYVFEGQSCSYGKPCNELQPSGTTVYSTYSETLSLNYGFKALTCPPKTAAADCMDGKCTLTGKTVTLTDQTGKKHQIPTAICQCQLTTAGGSTLGGQCNMASCSAVWSTASPGFLSTMPQCSQTAPGNRSRNTFPSAGDPPDGRYLPGGARLLQLRDSQIPADLAGEMVVDF
jgi:hypothetical protein